MPCGFKSNGVARCPGKRWNKKSHPFSGWLLKKVNKQEILKRDIVLVIFEAVSRRSPALGRRCGLTLTLGPWTLLATATTSSTSTDELHVLGNHAES